MTDVAAKIEIKKPIFRMPRMGVGTLGLLFFLLIGLPCVVTLPISSQHYDLLNLEPLQPPSTAAPADPEAHRLSNLMGSDSLGRSVLWRCLLGGAISLGIGVTAALISVFIGVSWGALSGLAGGRVDAVMMRIVDVLYGLPYILLVVLLKIALQEPMTALLSQFFDSGVASGAASILTLLIAIGGVSWLTMARVIRGQVLSLREQPFIEAARACGVRPWRILRVHLLPNLIGPIVVYTTLTVPTAILQESFLSFLGIGVSDPIPSWGKLAADGVREMPSLVLDGQDFTWWLLVWPCLLLGLTLMALNFLGDGLRNRLDPRSGNH
jgi:oligopeptide transport system permease protein